MADQNVQLIESEEDKKKKAAQAQPGSAFAGGTTSPVGAPSAAPSAGQQARAAQQAGPTKGTGFTGVGRYLQANVGSRLGEQVAGRVAQTGQQAQTRLGQAVGQFGQQLGSKDQGTGLYGQLTAQQRAAQGALQRIAGKPVEASVEQSVSRDLPRPSTEMTIGRPTPIAPTAEKLGFRTKEDEIKRREFEASLPAMSDSLKNKSDEYKKIIEQIDSRKIPMDYGPFSANAAAIKKMAEDRQKALTSFLSGLTPEERAEYDSRQYKPSTEVKPLSSVPSSISSLMPSQEEIAAYQAVAGGQYQAPSGLEDTAGIRSQAQLAAQLAKGTETTKGRMGLLQQVVGRGPQQYTKGKSALDALILGQSGGQLAAARRASAGLERKLGTEERLAQEQARQFGSDVERAKGALAGEATGFGKGLTEEIESKKTQFLESRSRIKKELEEALAKGELTEEQADILGKMEPIKIYGSALGELPGLLKSGIDISDVTSQAISTPEQAAKLNALYKLMGQKEFATADELKKAGSISDYKSAFSLDEPALARKKEAAESALKEANQIAINTPGIRGFLNSSNAKRSINTDESGNITKESAEKVLKLMKQNLLSNDPYYNKTFRAQDQNVATTLENYLKALGATEKTIKILPGPRSAMEEKFSKNPAVSPTGVKKR